MKLARSRETAPLPMVPAISLVALAVLMFMACATTPAPVEQIKYFSQAFSAVNTVGQPLLDDLALAERSVQRRQALLRAQGKVTTPGLGCPEEEATWAVAASTTTGFIDGFCLNDATYFAELGDPLATAMLRGGLRVIDRYAEVLTTLAEGRNLEQALSEVDALSQEVDGLLTLVGSVVPIGAALGALKPLLGNIAKQANDETARRLIIDGAPKVSALIAALRASAPEIFNTLIAGQRRAADVAATADSAVKEVEARRQVVSQYVVLLDKLQVAWDGTVTATRNPGGSRLADLVARTTELRVDADAVRKSFAVLRSTQP